MSSKQAANSKYCCKSCKAKDEKGSKWSNKTSLVIAIKKLIKTKGRYVTVSEILSTLDVSSSTLYRWNISTININKQLGYKCPKAYIEVLVEQHLKQNYPSVSVVRQKTFEELKGPKGGQLRYDICIDDTQGLIEVDDKSHWDTSHIYYSPQHCENDRRKDIFAQQLGIPLLRVKFTSIGKDLTYVLNEVDKFMSSLGYSKSNNP